MRGSAVRGGARSAAAQQELVQEAKITSHPRREVGMVLDRVEVPIAPAERVAEMQSQSVESRMASHTLAQTSASLVLMGIYVSLVVSLSTSPFLIAPC